MSEPKLNLVVIRSSNMDNAVAFYRALGLTFTKHSHGKGPEHFASEHHGIVFEIYPLKNAAMPTTGCRLGFQVADLEQIVQMAVRAGGVVVSNPTESEWGFRAVIDDPEGHRIELTESQEPD